MMAREYDYLMLKLPQLFTIERDVSQLPTQVTHMLDSNTSRSSHNDSRLMLLVQVLWQGTCGAVVSLPPLHPGYYSQWEYLSHACGC
jgi:hypothetical protein